MVHRDVQWDVPHNFLAIAASPRQTDDRTEEA